MFMHMLSFLIAKFDRIIFLLGYCAILMDWNVRLKVTLVN